MLTQAELQMLLSGLELAKLRPRRWGNRSAIERIEVQEAGAAKPEPAGTQ